VGRSVTDFTTIVAYYENTGAKAREQMRCQLSVPYGSTRAERLDIFLAERSGGPS
jgi:hypothetical protein